MNYSNNTLLHVREDGVCCREDKGRDVSSS